jgi:hypothetical protein
MEFQGNLYPLHLALDAALSDTAKVRDVQARAHPSGVFADPSDENTGYFLFLAIKKRYQIPAGFGSFVRETPLSCSDPRVRFPNYVPPLA